MNNPVMRWQLISMNPEASEKFYTQLFNWTVNADNPLGYREISTRSDEGIPGGIWPSPPEGASFVQLFVRVENVDDTLKTAQELGAKIIIPAQTLPDGETMAVIHDNEGVPVAIYSEKK